MEFWLQNFDCASFLFLKFWLLNIGLCIISVPGVLTAKHQIVHHFYSWSLTAKHWIVHHFWSLFFFLLPLLSVDLSIFVSFCSVGFMLLYKHRTFFVPDGLTAERGTVQVNFAVYRFPSLEFWSRNIELFTVSVPGVLTAKHRTAHCFCLMRFWLPVLSIELVHCFCSLDFGLLNVELFSVPASCSFDC